MHENKRLFLKEDLRDALKWLLVGAVVWEAAKEKELCPNQDAIGMFTNFVQARALYEFYYIKGKNDDARAVDFCDSWEPPQSTLFHRYVAKGKPLNKRVFHLVYGRKQEQHAGASGDSGPDHVNQQVLEFAKELLQVTDKFVQCVKPEFKDLAQSARNDSYEDAQHAANAIGVRIPF